MYFNCSVHLPIVKFEIFSIIITDGYLNCVSPIGRFKVHNNFCLLLCLHHLPNCEKQWRLVMGDTKLPSLIRNRATTLGLIEQ